MQREITMESVFGAGFKAAYRYWLDSRLEGPMDPEEWVEEPLRGKEFFDERNKAWLGYVKELERG